MGIQSVQGPDTRALAAQSQPRNFRPDASPEPVDKPDALKPAPVISTEAKERPAPNAVITDTFTASETGYTPEPMTATEREGTKIRVDKATERMVFQILGQEQEILKQIPPEELLKVIKTTRTFQGMLFDVQV